MEACSDRETSDLKIHVSYAGCCSRGPVAIVGGKPITIALCGRPVPANTVIPESLLKLWQEHGICRGALCRNCITKSGLELEPDQQEERD